MSIIFLIGMPACGKTYRAKQLSAYYKIPYLDLDIEIETQSGKTIDTIFKEQGEEQFRHLEHQTLKNIIANNDSNLILACGGGTPIYHNNMNLMKDAGCVVYLNADIDILTARIQDDASFRPLLQSNDLKSKLTALFEARKHIYEQADYYISAIEESARNFEQIIHSCTNRH